MSQKRVNDLKISFKNVYTTINKENILILYSISAKHYIGLKLYKEKFKDYIYFKSIDFYCDIKNIKEYKHNDFVNALYIKGKSIKITDKEFKEISKLAKKHFIASIENKTSNNTIDNLLFNKWFNDKYDLNNRKYYFSGF